LACDEKELSVLFTDDRRMATLNSRYMEREGPTNVLAFPMYDAVSRESAIPDVETALLGDVVISVETAQKEAKEVGETLEQTVDRLLIHGVLHLLGHDHVDSEEQADLMEKEEKRLLEMIDANRPFTAKHHLT